MKEIKEQVLSIINTIENGHESEGLDYYDGQYEEGEIISGLDYISDALDVNWILNSEREFKGARLLVAFGGPNIWINTDSQTVEGFWWGDSFTASYSRDAMGIQGACDMWFNC